MQNVRAAVGAAERRPTVQLFAPDGTFELVPLRFVDLDSADLAAVGAAVAALGVELAAGDELVRDVLACFADDPTKPGQLVAGFARAHGLVELAADADTWTLAGRLAGDPGPVVLNRTTRRRWPPAAKSRRQRARHTMLRSTSRRPRR